MSNFFGKSFCWASHRFAVIFLLFFFILLIHACGGRGGEEECENPNELRAGNEPEPKPMARMMRVMYKQGEEMRSRILAGDSISSDAFPLLNYHTQVPTDPSVLGPDFDRHHAEFSKAWEELMKSPDPVRYNLMLQACMGCHADHCPGPIKKIRKLSIVQ